MSYTLTLNQGYEKLDVVKALVNLLCDQRPMPQIIIEADQPGMGMIINIQNALEFMDIKFIQIPTYIMDPNNYLKPNGPMSFLRMMEIQYNHYDPDALIIIDDSSSGHFARLPHVQEFVRIRQRNGAKVIFTRIAS